MPGEFYENLRNERKAEILAAAKQRLLQDGFTHTMMISIAKEAGISRQTLYKYFDSLDDIIFCVQSQILHQRRALRQTLFDPATPVCDTIDSLVDIIFRDINENADDWLFLCMFDIYVAHHNVDTALIQEYNTLILQGDFFRNMLAESQRAGTVRADLDAGTLSSFVFTTILSFAQRMVIVGEDRINLAKSAPAEELAAGLKDMLRRFILPQHTIYHTEEAT